MVKKIDGEFFVLEEDISYQEFVHLAQEQGWVKQLTHHGDGKKEAFQEIWTTHDRKNVINYVDDPLTFTRFLWIRGSNLHPLLFEVSRRLPAYEPDDLLQMAIDAQNEQEAIGALLKIAVGFPDFDDSAFNIFRVYLTHPSPIVRKATVQAIAYRLWDESINLLEQVSKSDPEKDIREFVQLILEHRNIDKNN
ncbi:HEAT repeat domain-containing protein [Leptolyngbya sp. AN02str]|uniref:HEAT repeat domain-containing protein n=1 Tax=Leptolyngbya sp. AN02str TaxID=3423363 RepID=UPI003D319F30